MTDREQTCAERLPRHLEGRVVDLEALAAVARAADLSSLEGLEVRQLTAAQDAGTDVPSELADVAAAATDAAGSLENLEPVAAVLEDMSDGDAEDIAESAREALNNYGLALTVRTSLRWELSTGGPADWLEVDVERGRWTWEVTGARYVFQDWFDGANQDLEGRELQAVSDALEVLGALEPGVVLPEGGKR